MLKFPKFFNKFRLKLTRMRRYFIVLLTFFFSVTSIFAQTKTINGKVTDEKGQPVIGATISDIGPNKKILGTAVTDASGGFSIKVPNDSKSLRISSIGFSEQNISLQNLKGNISVKLISSTESLADVVVTTAGGLAGKKKDIGYANTQISGEDLTAARPVNIANGLQGKVAGLQISATNGGSNPSFRVVLRGQRSLTGNNQALIVLDNIIVPNEILGNLNPNDVEDIVVLNGAGAAALFGSEGSNGALLITSKKGSRTKAIINFSNTQTIETVSFFPKLQDRFGAGAAANFPTYTPYENQQYGPAFDGSIRPIGQPISDGTIQTRPYSPVNGKNSFWQQGISAQTDISISSGDEKGTTFFSAQYVDGKATIPKDKYNRAVIRLTGSRKMTRNLELNFGANYTQNRFDQTSALGTIYGNIMQTAPNIQITDYKDWRNDKFSSPDGYFNPYYQNPYFLLDNNRSYTRNDYLTANIDLKYTPTSWLDIVFRNGITTRNNTAQSTTDKYAYSDFAKATTAGSYKKTDIVGSYSESAFYSTRLTSEIQTTIRKKFNDFNFKLTSGFVVRQDQSRSVSASISGLVVPSVFNLSNTLVTPTASNSNAKARQMGLYGDLNLGYKGFINLHVTGRNDWVSTLYPENRSFFYPSVDLAFSPMELFPELKNNKVLSSLKLRGGWSKVGQVNLPGGAGFGAYQLEPTFSQQNGYPFTATGGGFGLNNTIVSSSLKPEITKGWEAGFDANFLKNRIRTNFSWYSTKTSDQTVTASISSASGFTSYLLNAALTNSIGIEATVNAVVIRKKDIELTVGAVFTDIIENNVLAISEGIEALSFGSGVSAVRGQPFPVIFATSYKRDPQNRIIVDPITGYPSRNDGNTVLGRTNPKNTLGLNFNLTYKNFSLSAQAEYRGGNVTYMNNTTAFDFSGGGLATVAFNRERFVFPNSSIPDPNKPGEFLPNTNITVRDGGYGFWTQSPRTGVAENYVASGAFWKMREITLGYELPQQLMSKIRFIKKAMITLQGRNLFMLLPKTNLYTDPEYSDNGAASNGVGVAGIASPPPSRYYGATISLTF